MAKLHIKKGDIVIVNSGDEKGNHGEVLSVDPAKSRAIVRGLNMVSKATKPSAANPQGGIIKTEAPIHISNLQVADPKDLSNLDNVKVGVRIGRRKNDEGKTVRYSKKSGEEIK